MLSKLLGTWLLMTSFLSTHELGSVYFPSSIMRHVIILLFVVRWITYCNYIFLIGKKKTYLKRGAKEVQGKETLPPYKKTSTNRRKGIKKKKKISPSISPHPINELNQKINFVVWSSIFSLFGVSCILPLLVDILLGWC